MEPKFIEKPEFKVIGMEIVTTIKDNQQMQTIPKLWEKFCSRMDEIPNRLALHESYGLCFGEGQDSPFTYMAALPVSDINVVPEGMISRTIPASKYAVFTSKGPLANLSKTYNYIYGTWLPQSGCKLSQSSDFEFYDERFDPNNDEKSEVDIYIPIQS